MANSFPTPARRPFGSAPARAWTKTGKGLALFATLLIISGGGILATAFASAAAAPTLIATPNTGLTNGQTIMLTGSGYTDSSIGNLLECNDAPNEPTAALGGLVNSAVSVGCTGPSLAANDLTSTSATGTISKAYIVAAGTIGPPCGTGDLVATCPTTDSSGGNTTTDAAKYPCPPTAAQQAAGVTLQHQLWRSGQRLVLRDHHVPGRDLRHNHDNRGPDHHGRPDHDHEHGGPDHDDDRRLLNDHNDGSVVHHDDDGSVVHHDNDRGAHHHDNHRGAHHHDDHRSSDDYDNHRGAHHLDD